MTTKICNKPSKIVQGFSFCAEFSLSLCARTCKGAFTPDMNESCYSRVVGHLNTLGAFTPDACFYMLSQYKDTIDNPAALFA